MRHTAPGIHLLQDPKTAVPVLAAVAGLGYAAFNLHTVLEFIGVGGPYGGGFVQSWGFYAGRPVCMKLAGWHRAGTSAVRVCKREGLFAPPAPWALTSPAVFHPRPLEAPGPQPL